MVTLRRFLWEFSHRGDEPRDPAGMTEHLRMRRHGQRWERRIFPSLPHQTEGKSGEAAENLLSETNQPVVGLDYRRVHFRGTVSKVSDPQHVKNRTLFFGDNLQI